MARATPEQAAAQKFTQAVSTLDFRPKAFAVIIGMSSDAVQRRCLVTMMAFVDYLAEKFDNALYTGEEEFELCIQAKRMQDAMVHFR